MPVLFSDGDTKISQAEYELLKLEDPLETQKQQLNRLMGRDVNTPFQVDPMSVADVAVPDLEEACARALASRPEILETRLRVEQAILGRKIANADRIPDIGLSATAIETVNLSNVLPNSFIGAGIQMNWDVFDWRRKRRKVDEACRWRIPESRGYGCLTESPVTLLHSERLV